jgi:hypothetical protein
MAIECSGFIVIEAGREGRRVTCLARVVFRTHRAQGNRPELGLVAPARSTRLRDALQGRSWRGCSITTTRRVGSPLRSCGSAAFTLPRFACPLRESAKADWSQTRTARSFSGCRSRCREYRAQSALQRFGGASGCAEPSDERSPASAAGSTSECGVLTWVFCSL